MQQARISGRPCLEHAFAKALATFVESDYYRARSLHPGRDGRSPVLAGRFNNGHLRRGKAGGVEGEGGPLAPHVLSGENALSPLRPSQRDRPVSWGTASLRPFDIPHDHA